MRSGGDPKRALVAGRTGPRIVTGANALLQLALLPAALAVPILFGDLSSIGALRFAAALSLCVSIVLLALIDAGTRTLPRRIVRPLYAGGLAYALLGEQLRCPGDADALMVQACSSLAVGLLAAGSMLVLSAAMRLLRSGSDSALQDDPVGAGDIRLIGAFGITFGMDLPMMLAVACIAACLYSLAARQGSFPFGPFLAMPALFVLCMDGLIGLP